MQNIALYKQHFLPIFLEITEKHAIFATKNKQLNYENIQDSWLHFCNYYNYFL